MLSEREQEQNYFSRNLIRLNEEKNKDLRELKASLGTLYLSVKRLQIEINDIETFLYRKQKNEAVLAAGVLRTEIESALEDLKHLVKPPKHDIKYFHKKYDDLVNLYRKI